MRKAVNQSGNQHRQSSAQSHSFTSAKLNVWFGPKLPSRFGNEPHLCSRP